MRLWLSLNLATEGVRTGAQPGKGCGPSASAEPAARSPVLMPGLLDLLQGLCTYCALSLEGLGLMLLWLLWLLTGLGSCSLEGSISSGQWNLSTSCLRVCLCHVCTCGGQKGLLDSMELKQ